MCAVHRRAGLFSRGCFAACVCLALGTGCEDAPPPDLSIIHLSGVDLATDATTPDASEVPAVIGVECGASVCIGEASQYCHTSDWGTSGVCVMRSVASPGYFNCDGKEDCGGGACCYLDSASACSSVGFCVVGTVVGEFMCHLDAECGAGSRCCPLRGGTTPGAYRTCVDGLAKNADCPPRT